MDVETSSNYSSDFVLTPTNTYTSPPEPLTGVAPPPYAPRIGPPYHGGTFIIRDIQSGLVVSATDQKIGLLPWGNGDLLLNCRDGRGSHWRCVENQNRWLGFKNTASGYYLQCSDGEEKLKDFCIQHHVSGGYKLLLKKGDRLYATKPSGTDSRKLVAVGRGGRGSLWEFLEVSGN